MNWQNKYTKKIQINYYSGQQRLVFLSSIEDGHWTIFHFRSTLIDPRTVLSSTFVSGQKNIVLCSNVVCMIICIVIGSLWADIANDFRSLPSIFSSYYGSITAATVHIFVCFFKSLLKLYISLLSFVDKYFLKCLIYSLWFGSLVLEQNLKTHQNCI